MTAVEIAERLTRHRALSGAPRQELEWLAARGELRTFKPGDILVREGTPIDELWVLLTGHFVFYTDRGSGRRKTAEWRGGDVAGLMPYSRLRVSPGEAIAEEQTDVLFVHRDHFAEMVRSAPSITVSLVHAMLDRARMFTTSDLHDEKMVSLGKLSAGLAHELNNPASAAARSAKQLKTALLESDAAAAALTAVGLTDEQRGALSRAHAVAVGATTLTWSPLELADHEDALADWLERHGADPGFAAQLAETALTVETLDELTDSMAPEQLNAGMQWIAAEYSVRALAAEIDRAASRIHELVSAVKRFTYMDRASVPELTNVAQGIADTLAVVASKARAKSVTMKQELPPDLPPVRGFGGELNQVWHNLIDNALDAVAEGGNVLVRARRHHDNVLVEIIDDGPGFPPEMRERIFDQFFTTKPVGQGTGLGLDIARRIVRSHSGDIEPHSHPGHTQFRVRLPIATDPPD